MSLELIIHAKQNGAQMATFAATVTRADIDDVRKKRKTMAALGTRLDSALKAVRKDIGSTLCSCECMNPIRFSLRKLE